MIGTFAPIPPEPLLPRGAVFSLRQKHNNRIFGFRQDKLPKSVLVVFTREADAIELGYSLEHILDRNGVIPNLDFHITKTRRVTASTELRRLDVLKFADIQDAITLSQNTYLDLLVCRDMQRTNRGTAYNFDGSIIIRNEDVPEKMRLVAERNFLASYV